MRQSHRSHPRHRAITPRVLAATVSLAWIAALLALWVPASPIPADAAVEWVITGPADVDGRVGAPVQLSGFEVTSGNPVSVDLAVTPSTAGTLTLTCAASCAGVTYDLGDGTTDRRIRLTGNRSAVNTAIASVRFDPSAVGSARITATAVDGTLGWLAADDHLYRFVPGTTTRANASATATGSSLHGWQGYLPTVTTDAERQLIRTLAGSADVHLGASDGAAEGTWKWNQGPESGTTLWTSSCGQGARGTCVATGAFNQWRDAEPDDAGGEDDLVQRADGRWSDVDGSSGCCATVIEYGGIGTFAPPKAEVAVNVLGTDPTTTTTTPASSTTTAVSTSTTAASTTSTTARATTTIATTLTPAPPPVSPVVAAAPPPTTAEPTTTPPTTAEPATTAAPGTTAAPATTAPTTTEPATTPGPPSTGGPAGTPSPAPAAAIPGTDPPTTALTAVSATVATDPTTIPPTTTVAAGTTSTTEPPTSRVDGRVRLHLHAAIGDAAVGRTVDFDATGLPPGLDLRGIVRSTPTVIATGTVDRDGTFHATGALPAGLAPGLHHLELSMTDGTALARAAFTVSATGTITESDAALGVIGGPYDPLQHVPEALGALVSTVVALGVLPRGGSSGSGSGGDSGDDGQDSGSVADLDIETDDGELSGSGWGDRRRTWALPGTAALDRWSVEAPARIQPRSAITARAVAEGAYLRAMVGILWAVVPVAGTVCGAIAWLTGDHTQVSPSWAWMAAALALGCIDGLAGLGAAVVIALLAIVGGSVTNVPQALTLAGLVVILAGSPVIATATRPLGRFRGRSPAGRWDRTADAVLASCVTAFAVQGMTGALSGLRGRATEIAQHADGLAIAALAAVTLRVLLESLANNGWPERRRALEPPEQPEPTALQGVLVPVMRGVLLVLASQRFIGTNWALWAGALLYAGPMVLNAAPERLGTHPWVHGWVPRRLSKWFFLLVGGSVAAAVLEQHVDDARTLLLVGFVAAQAPNAIVEVLEALGHDSDETELTWWHRAAGLVVFVVGALFALGRLP